MPIKIIYQGIETDVIESATASIGSDATSDIRIIRPGISRKHAVVSFDGSSWRVDDAGSRNGIYVDGERVATVVISGPTTLYFGHPNDGEAISFVPLVAESKERQPTHAGSTDSPIKPAMREQTPRGSASDAELKALTTAIHDQISSIKGLTWSVWAMIAVTAILAVMTLFIGLLGN